jgi:hypothetical protein
MRRAVAILLLTLVACSETSSNTMTAGSGHLTPENASIVATIMVNAPLPQVRELIAAIGEARFGVQEAGLNATEDALLVKFSADATPAQRRAAFARLAESGFFNSIQCSSCSEATPKPSATGT